MKTIVNILVENDGYLVKNPMNLEFTKILPKNIYRIPNIPFYHSSWVYMGKLIKPEIDELRECIIRQYGKLSNLNGMIGVPSDALPVDIRMLEQTFEICGIPKSKLVSKSSLLAINGVGNYIAISASERLVVLEWYNQGEAVETRYYNKSMVIKNKLLSDIGNIQFKQTKGNLNIFIFDACNELRELYDLGKVIVSNEMLEMLTDAGRRLYAYKK